MISEGIENRLTVEIGKIIAFLRIEVSDRTLKWNKNLKAPAYARAGIAEYWILNLNDRQMLVFREPGADGYASQQIISAAETIAPLAFANCQICVGDCLKPELF